MKILQKLSLNYHQISSNMHLISSARLLLLFSKSSFFRIHSKLSQISIVDFAGHINLMSQLSKISDPASVKVSETLE